jgi:hypothetical protein
VSGGPGSNYAPQIVQPVSIDAPDPLQARRERLERLVASHGRFRWVFAGLGTLALAAFGWTLSLAGPQARNARLGSLALAAFLLVNALASALKYPVLKRRLLEVERALSKREEER